MKAAPFRERLFSLALTSAFAVAAGAAVAVLAFCSAVTSCASAVLAFAVWITAVFAGGRSDWARCLFHCFLI